MLSAKGGATDICRARRLADSHCQRYDIAFLTPSGGGLYPVGNGGVGWDKSITREQPLFSLFIFSVAHSFRVAYGGVGPGREVHHRGGGKCDMELIDVLCVTHQTTMVVLLLLFVWELEWTDPQAGVSLFVLDGFLVTLSPLLLHDELHFSLCVFDHGSGNFDYVG